MEGVPTNTTSLGLPILIESIISTSCLFSSIFIYFFEKANVYCRALALQNIIVFYFFFVFFIFFVTSTLAFGGIWEFMTFAYIGLVIVFKIIMIVVAVIFSKSEKFIGIPPLTSFILSKAGAL